MRAARRTGTGGRAVVRGFRPPARGSVHLVRAAGSMGARSTGARRGPAVGGRPRGPARFRSLKWWRLRTGILTGLNDRRQVRWPACGRSNDRAESGRFPILILLVFRVARLRGGTQCRGGGSERESGPASRCSVGRRGAFCGVQRRSGDMGGRVGRGARGGQASDTSSGGHRAPA